jgi:hypothetical protein
MNEVVVYENASGGISIIIPAPECGLTIEEIAQKDVPPGTAYLIVPREALPADRSYRDAWRHDEGAISVDVPKARDIAHERRRLLREEEFAPLDKIIAAQIPGADAVAAEASRALIRVKYADMQTAIDAASTPEEITAALQGA